MNADIPSPVIAPSQQALMQFRDLDSPAAKAHALQRVPIAILALIGFGIATWLTLFQLGVLPVIWEPFFGEGSRRILSGRVSRLLPIPDAALGALGYLADALFGLAGGTARWRTQPWLVIVLCHCRVPVWRDERHAVHLAAGPL